MGFSQNLRTILVLVNLDSSRSRSRSIPSPTPTPPHTQLYVFFFSTPFSLQDFMNYLFFTFELLWQFWNSLQFSSGSSLIYNIKTPLFTFGFYGCKEQRASHSYNFEEMKRIVPLECCSWRDRLTSNSNAPHNVPRYVVKSRMYKLIDNVYYNTRATRVLTILVTRVPSFIYDKNHNWYKIETAYLIFNWKEYLYITSITLNSKGPQMVRFFTMFINGVEITTVPPRIQNLFNKPYGWRLPIFDNMLFSKLINKKSLKSLNKNYNILC